MGQEQYNFNSSFTCIKLVDFSGMETWLCETGEYYCNRLFAIEKWESREKMRRTEEGEPLEIFYFTRFLFYYSFFHTYVGRAHLLLMQT